MSLEGEVTNPIFNTVKKGELAEIIEVRLTYVH